MSYSHEVTFRCDACDQNYMIDKESMELPPGWLGLQIVIADTEGFVPDHEQEVYCHFCTQDCLIEYTASDDMRQRLALTVAVEEEEDDDEEGTESRGNL